MIGETLGNYRIIKKIDEGGMGTIYLAEHHLLGHSAAVKLLLPQLSHNQEIVNRFFNEAKATSAIAHPGIVRVFDFGYHRNQCAYLVMELLDGESLDARLARCGRLALLDALRVAHHCASTLAAVHVIGVVHRDLKPDNIFLVADPLIDGGERAKILDFGIAKLLDQQDQRGSIKTRTGCVMGTPVYMSPEQCRNAGEVDDRADIYSLGCVLFHLLCGRPPFTDMSPGDVIASHLREPAPSLRAIDPSIPAPIADLVAKTLVKDPRRRFASMGELADELARLIQAVKTGSGQQATRMLQANGPAPAPIPRAMALVSPYGPDTATLASMPNQTTLAAAAAERAAPSRLRRGWTSVMAFLSAVLAGCLLTALITELRPREPATTAAPDAAYASMEPILPSEPAPPIRESRPARVAIDIRSDPSGAELFEPGADEPLGSTPYRYTTAPSDDEIRLRVVKEGYVDGEVSFIAERSKSVEIALGKRAPRNAHSRRRRSQRPRRSATAPGKKRGARRAADRDEPSMGVLEYR